MWNRIRSVRCVGGGLVVIGSVIYQLAIRTVIVRHYTMPLSQGWTWLLGESILGTILLLAGIRWPGLGSAPPP
jgi:hypothetical protein